MIKVFKKDETNFLKAGKIIHPERGVVHAEKNGEYSLSLVLPIDDKTVEAESLIMAPVPVGEPQLFRAMVPVTNTETGEKEVYARHIFYDLDDNFLEDARATGNGTAALQKLLESTQFPSGFEVMSDIESVSTAYWQMLSPVEALLGSRENSFVNRWGGTIFRDNKTIKFLKNAGRPNPVRVAYGKNLVNCGLQADYSRILTRLMPTGLKEDGQTLLKLPEKYVDSPLLKNYTNPKIGRVHFSEIKVGEEEGEYPTEEAAFEALREAARKMFDAGADKPILSGSVIMADLAATKEFETVKSLESLYPYDKIRIELPQLETSVVAEMQSFDFDVLTETYESITFGAPQAGSNVVLDKLGQIAETLKDDTLALDAKIDISTRLLTSALGGYVLKKENEILIMDTQNPLTAKKIWRWNLNGLGYSKTGINGPYGLAITMDGYINADFIKAGSLDAGLIKTGRLQSKNGASYIDMDTGEFMFSVIRPDADGWLTQTKVLSLDSEKNLNVFGSLKSSAYPQFSLKIGPSIDNTSDGALTITDDNVGEILQCYRIHTADGLPGMVLTAPAFLNAEKTNRKGLSITDDDITLFRDNYVTTETGETKVGNSPKIRLDSKKIESISDELRLQAFGGEAVVYGSAGAQLLGQAGPAAMQGTEARVYGGRCYVQTDRDTLSLTNDAPHASFWINYYGDPAFHLKFPNCFCFGDGTGGGLADLRAKNMTAEANLKTRDLTAESGGYFKTRISAGSAQSGYYPDCAGSFFGNIGVDGIGYATKWDVWSMRECKTNILEQKVDATSKIAQLHFYKYDFKKPPILEKIKDGLAAAVNKAAEKKPLTHVEFGIMTDEAPPEILSEEGKAIDLYSYIGLCAAAIQEQAKKINELEKELKAWKP